MNTQDFDEVNNQTPEPVNHLSGSASSISWNPDAIDVTANPNKGRKSTTEKVDRIGRMSTTTEKHEFRINVIEPKPPKPESQNIKTITPGVKDSVLKSEDYKKWLEKKNSFLFQPASVEYTTMVPTSIAAPVTRLGVLYYQETISSRIQNDQLFFFP